MLHHRHFLLLVAFIAGLGGFLFGYDTGIIAGALIFVKLSFNVSIAQQEWIVSSVVLGALFGALLSGRLADHFGRRTMLMVAALAFIIGSVLTTIAWQVSVLIIGRLVLGLAIGVTSYTTPLFISEMAPASRRGALVLINVFAITAGEAIAFLVDYLLVPTGSWRLMFATCLVPAILFFTGLFTIPPSPRFMVLKGFTERAYEILCMIRPRSQVKQELADITNLAETTPLPWRKLLIHKHRQLLLIGIGLGVLQQAVGINTVMYYGPTVFAAAGFKGPSSQLLATFIIGLVNTVMSVLAIVLVDKIGRRRLLLMGLSVAAIGLACMGLLFKIPNPSWAIQMLTLTMVMIYIGGYSVSIGSLFWLIIAEIYPLAIRGLAMSIVTAVQWFANFIIAVTFLTILNHVGASWTFWMYGSLTTLGIGFCYFLVPETNGMSLEQIEIFMQGKPETSNC